MRRFDLGVISCRCVDKKLCFIVAELESIGVSVAYGTIELVALEATLPRLSSRIDASGARVPNRSVFFLCVFLRVCFTFDVFTAGSCDEKIETRPRQTVNWLVYGCDSDVVLSGGCGGDGIVIAA